MRNIWQDKDGNQVIWLSGSKSVNIRDIREIRGLPFPDLG